MKYFILFLSIVFSINLFASNQSETSGSSESPVTFLQNKGQWPTQILYQGTSTENQVYFMRDGLSFGQTRKISERINGEPENSYLVWNMKFLNPNPSAQISGEVGKESRLSFLYGNDPTQWVIHPPEYAVLKYRNIYCNIDLQFYGNGNNLKYDYIVHPGGILSSISMFYDGIDKLSVNEKGDLEIITAWDTQLQKTPVAWQVKNGIKQPVNIQYVILNDTTFGFTAVEGYDSNYDLVIDPLFQMVWASYTKATGISNNRNYCFSNAMDPEGNVYLTGMVDGTYPTTPGAYSGPGSVSPQIFVSKFSKDGDSLLYSTYVAGSSAEMGLGIAVDDSGRAYITGHAMANYTGGNTYPTTASAYQPAMYPSGGLDVIFTVLNATGTGLVYSTYFGGSNNEEGYAIVLGNDGMAYITGFTSSLGTFPLKASSAIQSGNHDVFVAKFDITQSGANSLVYSVRIGGNGSGFGRSIAVNSSGNAFVTGKFQEFGSPSYPTSPGAYNSVYNGGSDNMMVFATKLSATIPISLDYSTYIGPGMGSAIAADSITNDVYITGNTRTFTFPITPGVLQPIHGQDALGNANNDAFVTKLNAAGTALIYSTFLGGESEDKGTGIAINSVGEAYVVGTASFGFPTSAGALQPNYAGGGLDFFAVHINASANAYGCGGSTFIGGSGEDYGTLLYDYPSPKVAIRDHSGINDTISVSGTSHSVDFPTTPGVYGPVKVNAGADQPVFFKLTCASVIASPVVNFNTNIIPSCLNAVINLQDNSTNNPTSWQWNFPGAIPSTSNAQNPQGITYSANGSYDITLVACNASGCDSLTITIQITILQNNPAVSLGPDIVLCNNDSVLVSATPGYSNYQWFINGNMITSNLNTIYANQQGIYVVNITDSLGCTGTDTLNATASSANITLMNDTTLCAGNPLNIIADTGYVSYQWTVNGNVISTSPSIMANQSGNYILAATNMDGCIANDSVEVTINPLPFVESINDLTLCLGDTVTLTTTGAINYQWSPATYLSSVTASSPISSPANNISYVVIGTDMNGCSGTDTIDIQVVDLPIADFAYQLQFNCNGIELTTENKSINATQYFWNFGDGNTSSEENPIHAYTSVQNMTLQLIASNGVCSDTLSVENISFEIPVFQNLPNVITPNNDNLNECFQIKDIEKLTGCFSLMIFNRWGNLVFETDNNLKCWDGKNNHDTDLSDGIYFYKFKISNIELYGLIHLIR